MKRSDEIRLEMAEVAARKKELTHQVIAVTKEAKANGCRPDFKWVTAANRRIRLDSIRYQELQVALAEAVSEEKAERLRANLAAEAERHDLFYKEFVKAAKSLAPQNLYAAIVMEAQRLLDEKALITPKGNAA